MARPSQDAIDTFVSITGASESLALRKLEEHGGNLDEAINAHFGEVDRHITNPASAAPQPYNVTDMNDQSQARPRGLDSKARGGQMMERLQSIWAMERRL
uniref:Uncharacterized protein n=1 Tax=Fagus sylvatica TaxID=28930 RepID=A0A2N9FWM0_FAGSY